MKQERVATWTGVGSREAALVQRCAANDHAAFAELVTEHRRMVVQLALNLLGDEDEALDVSQEVFLTVFRTIHGFHGRSALRTWIYRIAINHARNRYRFWKRRHRADQVSLDQHLEAHADAFPQEDSSPDREFARRELGARLKRAFNGLPFEQRTAIVLREIDGLTTEEISLTMDVSLTKVKSLLTRARLALRAELREPRIS